MWSKVKACLRKLKAKTKEALEPALVEALNEINTTDVAAWFQKWDMVYNKLNRSIKDQMVAFFKTFGEKSIWDI